MDFRASCISGRAKKAYNDGDYEAALRRVSDDLARNPDPAPSAVRFRDHLVSLLRPLQAGAEAKQRAEESPARATQVYVIPVHAAGEQGPRVVPIYTPHSEENKEEESDDDDMELQVKPRGAPKEVPVYEGKQTLQQESTKEEENEEEKAAEATEQVQRTISESTLYQRGPAGFQNHIGENNCFLNVVLQSLFLLAPFATEFAALTKHTHTKSCVYCALKEIFANYQFGDERVIPPTVMRRTLCDLFAPESRFAMNDAEDANEALEEILTELHAELCAGRPSEACSPPCLVHRVFGMELTYQDECARCHARGEPLIFSEWVLYCPVQALVEARGACGTLEACMRHTFSDRHYSCPDATRGCRGATAQRHQYLLVQPPVFTLGLTWPLDGAPQLAGPLVDMLPLRLDLNAVFQYNGPDARDEYVLRGVICFYGHHYVLLFMARDKEQPDYALKRWLYFDDSLVRPIGTWRDVKPFIASNAFRPTIAFYVRP